jgi:hypothetical protein
MFNPSKRSLLALALCTGMIGAMAATSASPASAAPAAVTVNATLQTQTLKVTGSNFVPGSKVAIAVVNTSTWKMVATGSTYAQFAVRQCSPLPYPNCSEPNPLAGSISYSMHLKAVAKASDLHVLYRSAGKTGSQAVQDSVQTASPPRHCGFRADCILP